jgi:CRP-like cAMP-binding protein
MIAMASSFPPPTNRLLATLPAGELQRLLPNLELVSLELKQTLCEPGLAFDYAYFFESGLASVVMLVGGASIEVATIGNEGMFGLPMLMNEEKATYRCFMQGSGQALRMPASALRREGQQDTAFRRLLYRYQNVFTTTVMQTGACNGIHKIGPRCCKWLLLCHDRIKIDKMPLTHEFLSLMLGVRRASISDVLAPLRDAGMIQYSRGHVTVLDRKRLEENSCECYGEIVQQHRRLFEGV